MSYKLKPKELAFQVTREGKFEYRRYKHGETYNEVPPEDMHRFEQIKKDSTDLKGKISPIKDSQKSVS